MAKIRKNLDYLPLDVNIFADRKIKRLMNTFGGKGFLVYIIILTEVYKNGYFLVWDKDYPEDIAMMLGEGIKANLVLEVVNHCVNKFGLFDRELFDSSILTSKGIQQRYLHAKESICKKTFKLEELFPKYCLLENISELTPINGDYPENSRNEPINADERRQVKLSKVNLSEIEVEDNIPPISPQGDVPKTTKRFTRPTIDEIKQYCSERNNTVDPQKFLDYYESNGWKVGKNSMKDWKAAVRTWERNTFSVKQLKTSFNENDVLKEFLNGK